VCQVNKDFCCFFCCRYKLRPPKGLLLHGPPGSGKTALARAAAVEAGAALLVVNGPDILTEFYGEV
jgi:AAA family ATPase